MILDQSLYEQFTWGGGGAIVRQTGLCDSGMSVIVLNLLLGNVSHSITYPLHPLPQIQGNIRVLLVSYILLIEAVQNAIQIQFQP